MGLLDPTNHHSQHGLIRKFSATSPRVFVGKKFDPGATKLSPANGTKLGHHRRLTLVAVTNQNFVERGEIITPRLRQRGHKFRKLEEVNIGITSWCGDIAEPPIFVAETIARLGINNVSSVLQKRANPADCHTKRMKVFGVVAAQDTRERIGDRLRELLQHNAPCACRRHFRREP